MRDDFINEISTKREMGIKDFSLLSSQGVLGNYLECELTHIFIVERKTNQIYHYYAICSYEEFLENDVQLRDISLTRKLVQINEHYSLGIKQMRLSLEESREIFYQLTINHFHFRDCTVVLPKIMQLLPKTHIPSLFGYNGVQLNNILKPNFWGDRYILEFISIETPLKKYFSATNFDKVNEEISKFLSIKLSLANDRIGSFIFQFPITLVSVDSRISHDWCKAVLSMKTYPGLNEPDNICTIVKTNLDDTTTGFNSFHGNFDSVELNLGDSNNFELLVFNTTNSIIYEHSSCNFLRDFYISGGISIQNAEPRLINHEDGSITEITLLNHELGFRLGNEKYYDSRINDRVIHNEILNHGGDFQNFYPGEHDKALNYIREKLRTFSSSASEIWLWDPFLCYQDVIETLYYVEIINLPMKCITSFDKKKTFYKNYLHFREAEKSKFLAQKNLGINLEFRAVYNDTGFQFHDRFLYFIPNESDKIPRVYSLGTSINGLGNKHHLIMQTVYPRNIVTAFNELWQKLTNDDNSLIIKLPEGK